MIIKASNHRYGSDAKPFFLSKAGNLCDCTFVLTLTACSVHFVRVHKPAVQPAVEYEQADVSTANC
ncbi:hypothetical protein T4B_8025, partial [Trichinella pseudospiralis]